jgi:hypothetical protein
MTGRVVSRQFRRLAFFTLALFAVFLATAQLEHHDIACHLKTPQHCSACAAPLGANPNEPAATHKIVLADAGGAVVDARLLSSTVLPTRSSGRSPPSIA